MKTHLLPKRDHYGSFHGSLPSDDAVNTVCREVQETKIHAKNPESHPRLVSEKSPPYFHVCFPTLVKIDRSFLCMQEPIVGDETDFVVIKW